jgi:SAM-dependent methyltransferase
MGQSASTLETLRSVVAEYNQSPLAAEWPFNADEISYHLRLIEACQRYIGQSKRPTVLDIGTGRGICPRFFAKTGARSLTVDFPAAGAGNAALRNAALAGVETREADCSCEPLPLESDSVDCVCLLDVIEHLPHSPRHLLREIARVLRPGGVCITSTPNAVRLTARLKVLLGHSNWPHVADYHDLPFHAGHHHEYTESELRFVHEKAGLPVASLLLVDLNLLRAPIRSLGDLQSRLRPRGADETLRYRFPRLLLHTITKVLPNLRGQMILTARKSA